MAAFTPASYVREWTRRTGRVRPSVAELVRYIGVQMLAQSLHNLQRMIYSIPEDVSGAGRKKWQRTFKLINGEKIVYAPDESACTLFNAVPYARARHELGQDGRKTKRPAHWRDGVLMAIRDDVHARAERMGISLLGGR